MKPLYPNKNGDVFGFGTKTETKIKVAEKKDRSLPKVKVGDAGWYYQTGTGEVIPCVITDIPTHNPFAQCSMFFPTLGKIETATLNSFCRTKEEAEARWINYRFFTMSKGKR